MKVTPVFDEETYSARRIPESQGFRSTYELWPCDSGEKALIIIRNIERRAASLPVEDRMDLYESQRTLISDCPADVIRVSGLYDDYNKEEALGQLDCLKAYLGNRVQDENLARLARALAA